jgi:hypothetical protein
MSTQDQIYDPNGLFDAVMEKHQLKNDAALARALEVAPPVISKIRHFHLRLGASMILAIHEKSGVPVSVIRAYVPA